MKLTGNKALITGGNSGALAAFFQQGVAAWIADHDLPGVGLEHIVPPCRPGPFFQRHMQFAPQTVQEVQQRGCFGFDGC